MLLKKKKKKKHEKDYPNLEYVHVARPIWLQLIASSKVFVVISIEVVLF